MKDIIQRKGYKILDSYRANSGQIKIIIKDREGYRYDVQLYDAISPEGKHYFVSPANPFSLENISLWLRKMKLNFSLCENNRYINKESPLSLFCSVCGDIFSKPWNEIRNNPSCPICSNRRVGNSNNLLIKYPQSKNVWNYDKNEDVPENYLCTNRSLAFWWYCENEEHETFQRTIWNSTRCNFMCPKCSRNKKNSKLHNLVTTYLLERRFELNFEHDCSILPINPDNGYLMPYDIEVVNISLIIEIQGEQHSKLGGWHKKLSNRDPWGRSPMEMFHYQQWKDRYKKDFAIKNGYKYLEIPYNSISNDSWKNILDEEIRQY